MLAWSGRQTSRLPADLGDEGEEYLAFETLTACPIDRKLIDTSLLRPAEASWIDGYHRWVRDTLWPQVDGVIRDWLVIQTEPLEFS